MIATRCGVLRGSTAWVRVLAPCRLRTSVAFNSSSGGGGAFQFWDPLGLSVSVGIPVSPTSPSPLVVEGALAKGEIFGFAAAGEWLGLFERFGGVDVIMAIRRVALTAAASDPILANAARKKLIFYPPSSGTGYFLASAPAYITTGNGIPVPTGGGPVVVEGDLAQEAFSMIGSGTIGMPVAEYY